MVNLLSRCIEAMFQEILCCRTSAIAVERRLLGSPDETDEKIQSMEFAQNDQVLIFTVLLRAPDEVILQSRQEFDTIAYFRARQVGDELELLFGSALPGAGFQGVPLHMYILTSAFIPFHRLYARLLLSHAAKKMVQDASSKA
jgi:hypothetical protein